MEKIRQISWGNAIVGGLLGFALTLVFVLFVSTPLATAVAGMGVMGIMGVTILVLALLRMVAGMWTAQLVRRKYEVRRRGEFLPTAVVAGLIGWLLYTALVLVGQSALGTEVNLLQLFLDVLQWVAEFGLGAFLVSPERQEAKATRR